MMESRFFCVALTRWITRRSLRKGVLIDSLWDHSERERRSAKNFSHANKEWRIGRKGFVEREWIRLIRQVRVWMGIQQKKRRDHGAGMGEWEDLLMKVSPFTLRIKRSRDVGGAGETRHTSHGDHQAFPFPLLERQDRERLERGSLLYERDILF